MKYLFSSLIVIYFSYNGFGQVNKEFKKLDSLNSYKDVKLDNSVLNIKKQMGLVYKKGSDGFEYLISNKKYLKIDSFLFTKGEVWFLFKNLKYITLESNPSNPEYFKNFLDYLTTTFGQPVEKNQSYYWLGQNISYNLIGDSTHILFGVTH
jgi:hypothetical protein